MCHAMDAFQMKSIFKKKDLAVNCIVHPLETLTPVAPNDVNFVVISTLKTLPCFFKASMITLVRLSAQPPSVNCSK